MSNCKGNNNDEKNLCLEGELHVYIFELFLIYLCISIFIAIYDLEL